MRRETYAVATVPANRPLPALRVAALAWLTVAPVGTGVLPPATPATSGQPNIMLILTDDQDG